MRNYTPVPVCCVLRRLLRRASAPSLNEGRIRKREPSSLRQFHWLPWGTACGLDWDTTVIGSFRETEVSRCPVRITI